MASARYCREGRENLCEKALFTGYDRDGGYAELLTADERFCYPIPVGYPDLSSARLLCGGLIGNLALGRLRSGAVRGSTVLLLEGQ